MTDFHEDVERLDSIPGIATRMAEQILAEIGTDVKKQFPGASHLCSWAGLVPGHNESAGKRKSSKTKKGNKYLKSALTEAAQGSLSTFLHNLILFQQNIKLIFNNRFLLVEIKTRRYSSQRIAPDC